MNWNQLQAILWLRWRITVNSSFKRSSIAGILAVALSVIVAATAAGASLGTFFVGFRLLRTISPDWLQIVWTGAIGIFCFVWTLGMITELQRSESIDIPRLMHLPVRLGQVFVINYIASHAVFSIAALLPAMLGLALGLAFGRGLQFLLLAPLIFSVIYMITAWTYCLRGWLATLMSNPRRRRLVTAIVTVCFLAMVQGPNLYFNVLRRGQFSRSNRQATTNPQTSGNAEMQRAIRNFNSFARYIPPLWLPLGAKGLADGTATPALLGTLGCALLGTAGLRRAYRSTLRYYQGDSPSKTPRSKPAGAGIPPAPSSNRRSRILELKIWGIPEPAVAVAAATFKSLLRAPEIKMALGSWVLVAVVLGGSMVMRAPPTLPDAAKPLILTGAVAAMLVALFQIIGNQFGFDRDGFRIYVLSPIDRRHVLLGKNLAWWPLVAFFGLLLIAAATWWLRTPLDATFASIFQLASLFLIVTTLANLLSILLPFRMQPNAMKPSKPPFLKLLAIGLCQIFLPIALAPAVLPPGIEWFWRHSHPASSLPINLILSIVVFILSVVGYRLGLDAIGALLSKREELVLKAVTAEGE